MQNNDILPTSSFGDLWMAVEGDMAMVRMDCSNQFDGHKTSMWAG
jgi:hypothetical protein